MTIKKIVIIIIILVLFFLLLCYNKYKLLLLKDHNNIFHDINEFPELQIIEDNWKVIRDEMPEFKLENLNSDLERSIGVWNTNENIDILKKINDKVDWVTGWSNNWFHFPIYYLGKPINNINKILPKTYEILSKIPSIYVAGYSILLPNATLPWHVDETGSETHSLAMNLGLDSDNSILYVKGNREYIHEKKQANGKSILFDSNYKHEVINKSNTNVRVILYIDFKTDQVYGRVMKGLGYAKKLDYPTINLELHRDIDCGMYNCITDFGSAMLYVDHTKKYGELHLYNYDTNIDKESILFIKNMRKIIPQTNNGIISNYYRGCKC